ncbi:BQ2448_7209 [Microbotryum intermedium]|uniref:tRNA(His) guanylyltransferase n=1 Tax=Microbotryum intermedium TaxID=269621 RepID=A0A238FMP9_9BASI|nr:BQ2448_7209 [Microbotryum intermedium]
MANSRYSYVRLHEIPDALLPSTFLIIRLDGKAFHKFSSAYAFIKPNDRRALDLMNAAAKRVMGGREVMGDLVMGFGESDEYSFLFKRSTKLHGRRNSKLVTLISSLFTTAYTFLWPQYFPDSPLELDQLPIFDGRIVQYCTKTEVKDYFRWRQVDTHINNLYNTCFWTLVQKGGLTTQQANAELSGTISSEKQELLFTRFGMNYNREEEMFKKGSIWVWVDEENVEGEAESMEEVEEGIDRLVLESQPIEPVNPERPRRRTTKPSKPKRVLKLIHEDLIKDKFWTSGYGNGALEGFQLTLNKTNIAERHVYPTFQPALPLLSCTVSLDSGANQAPSQQEWRLDASNLPQLLEDSPGHTLRLLMAISVYDEKAENTPQTIGKRLKQHERLALTLEQVKVQHADKSQVSQEPIIDILFFDASGGVHPFFAETRLERHLHDLRFFLRSMCSYFDDLLASTFNEAERRVFNNEKTRSDSKEPITSKPRSITCLVPIHPIVVEEERKDTFASYKAVLGWLRCGQINFGPMILSAVGTRAHSIEAPLQEIPFTELDATPESEPRSPVTATIASPEGVYRLCDRLCLPELRMVAFDNLKAEMTSHLAPYAFFSIFSCHFKEIAEFCMQYCAEHWSEVDKSPQMDHIRSLIEQDELAIGGSEGARLISRLFIQVMSYKKG